MSAATIDRHPTQHSGEGLTPQSAPLDVLGRVALGVEPGLGDALMIQAGHGLDGPTTPKVERTSVVWQEIPKSLQVPSAESLVISPVVRHTLQPPK